MAPLGYTITKVGLTNKTASYPAVCLYFVVQFDNGVVNDFVFPDLLANIANSAWSATTGYYVGQVCILNYVSYICIASNSVDTETPPVGICVGKPLSNTTYWAVQSNNVLKDELLRAMTGFVANMVPLGYTGNMVDPNITVNPNVGGVPAAAIILNGTSGTI